MPLLVCFDTIHPMEGGDFAKEFPAHKQFFTDFCSVPVTVALRERVHWLTAQKPSWPSRLTIKKSHEAQGRLQKIREAQGPLKKSREAQDRLNKCREAQDRAREAQAPLAAVAMPSISIMPCIQCPSGLCNRVFSIVKVPALSPGHTVVTK